MRVYVKQTGHIAIRLAFPTRMLINRLTAGVALKAIQKGNHITVPLLSQNDLRRLIQTVFCAKRSLRGLPLISVESANGTTVRICL